MAQGEDGGREGEERWERRGIVEELEGRVKERNAQRVEKEK